MSRGTMYLACCMLVLGIAAGPMGVGQTTTANGAPTQKQSKSPSASPQSAPLPAVDQAELEAMKMDLQRMNVILNQMRSNLGFVTNTTGPLKHQFELDIDMWQMMLSQMERRVQRMESQGKK
ncbi:MAG: hypothetical protein LAN37_12150 [Acidobacteriia bacterium]|nr:hypothetical protein [Terriglobia bacterium]